MSLGLRNGDFDHGWRWTPPSGCNGSVVHASGRVCTKRVKVRILLAASLRPASSGMASPTAVHAFDCGACSLPNGSPLSTDGLDVAGAIDAAARANGSEQILGVVRRAAVEEVNVLVLGGSMTLGHDAECPHACFKLNDCPCAWPKLLSRALSSGGARARITSRAIGGTSSKWALYNEVLWADQLYDLVIIDYVVNDAGAYDWHVYSGAEDYLTASEALVRQVLSMPQTPALLVLHTVPASLATCHWDLLRWQRPLLDHYGVPVLSYAHAISPSLDPRSAHNHHTHTRLPLLQVKSSMLSEQNLSAATVAKLAAFWGRCPGTYHPSKRVQYAVAQLVSSFWWHLVAISWQKPLPRSSLTDAAQPGPAPLLLPRALYGGSTPICASMPGAADRPFISYSAQQTASRQHVGSDGANTNAHGNRDSDAHAGDVRVSGPHLGGEWRLGEEERGKPGWLLPPAIETTNISVAPAFPTRDMDATRSVAEIARDTEARDVLRFSMRFSSTPTLVITALTSYTNMGKYRVCLRLANSTCGEEKSERMRAAPRGRLVECRPVCSQPFSTQWMHHGSLFTSRVLRRQADLPPAKWGMPAGSEGLSATDVLEHVRPKAEYDVSLIRDANSKGKLKITAVASC